jgi:hypothetical protein
MRSWEKYNFTDFTLSASETSIFYFLRPLLTIAYLTTACNLLSRMIVTGMIKIFMALNYSNLQFAFLYLFSRENQVQALVNVSLPLWIVLGVTENMQLIICHRLVVRHMQELLYMIFLWRLIMIPDLKL